MIPMKIFVWGPICPPSQDSMDWYVNREWVGHWYYQITNSDILDELQRCDEAMPEEVPYIGENYIEIP